MGFPPQGTSKTRTVSVTVTANGTTGSAAHNMGKTPKLIGRPNPNQLDGLDSISSVDATDVTVTCYAPVTTQTIFTVEVK